MASDSWSAGACCEVVSTRINSITSVRFSSRCSALPVERYIRAMVSCNARFEIHNCTNSIILSKIIGFFSELSALVTHCQQFGADLLQVASEGSVQQQFAEVLRSLVQLQSCEWGLHVQTDVLHWDNIVIKITVSMWFIALSIYLQLTMNVSPSLQQ